MLGGIEMKKMIFTEENGVYQVDFSEALWASDKAHLFLSGLPLSDVDWVAETISGFLFVEYKNSNIKNASNPEAFLVKLEEEKHYTNISKKFYDSLVFLIMSNKMPKDITYIYIFETPTMDSTMRKMLRNKILKYLPLKQHPDSENSLMSHFDILSIREWNEHYPNFPLVDCSTT